MGVKGWEIRPGSLYAFWSYRNKIIYNNNREIMENRAAKSFEIYTSPKADLLIIKPIIAYYKGLGSALMLKIVENVNHGT